MRNFSGISARWIGALVILITIAVLDVTGILGPIDRALMDMRFRLGRAKRDKALETNFGLREFAGHQMAVAEIIMGWAVSAVEAYRFFEIRLCGGEILAAHRFHDTKHIRRRRIARFEMRRFAKPLNGAFQLTRAFGLHAFLHGDGESVLGLRSGCRHFSVIALRDVAVCNLNLWGCVDWFGLSFFGHGGAVLSKAACNSPR